MELPSLSLLSREVLSNTFANPLEDITKIKFKVRPFKVQEPARRNGGENHSCRLNTGGVTLAFSQDCLRGWNLRRSDAMQPQIERTERDRSKRYWTRENMDILVMFREYFLSASPF